MTEFSTPGTSMQEHMPFEDFMKYFDSLNIVEIDENVLDTEDY